MPKFYIFNHQNKSKRLTLALAAAGFIQVSAPLQADVIFTDRDIQQHCAEIDRLRKRGKVIMMVPHAAMPNFFGDFENYKSYSHTTVQFVPAQGHVDVMRAWGYSLPLEVIGWYLCQIMPFTPRANITNVLFAPIHPNMDSTLSDSEKGINAAAYKKLLGLVDDSSICLTVRHLRGLEYNGLWRYPGVVYVAGKPDQTTSEIDAADVVVSKKTMQYLTVARGVPCIGMGEWLAPPMGSLTGNNYAVVKSWDKYKEIMAYPLDILSDVDTLTLLKSAAASDSLIADWRARMIGEQFDEKRFTELVLKYL